MPPKVSAEIEIVAGIQNPVASRGNLLNAEF
jgi:hypothetical protein